MELEVQSPVTQRSVLDAIEHQYPMLRGTIRDHVTIGEKCVLGAGALVLEDQPDFSVVAPRGTERSPVPSTRLRNL